MCLRKTVLILVYWWSSNTLAVHHNSLWFDSRYLFLFKKQPYITMALTHNWQKYFCKIHQATSPTILGRINLWTSESQVFITNFFDFTQLYEYYILHIENLL